jgi:hypothetical protein
MIIRYCKKNIYSILAVFGVLLIFDPIKNWCSTNWNWLAFFVIIVYGFLYAIDCVIKWIWAKYFIMGKLAVRAAAERKQEREIFGQQLVEADKIGKITGDWTLWENISNRKHKQIHYQNIILFNAWLKR